ncbi:type II toxin-antitoxin system antitoxin SocA domain-containing protein [uncultured Paludibaculum sp.]|uniref:Panacea domain-containing protein n=1 Tax=uncultured Paludibaculum sp. TaxID=1765020 RepID=UPI002AAC4942|nr:type II toxin-antitoxin system antitoxin SocA domain-containing protein [uncultured Paludibaculum sp.]
MITAQIVADYFIAFSHRHGDPVSNLKLQKLLYYAQAWHLAIHDEPLFREPIQAWVHGPVVPSVYHRYKDWAWKPIEDNPDLPVLGQTTEDHLAEVMSVYGTMTAYALELLTHEEAPWRNARGGLAADEPSAAVISHEDMRTFYRSQMNG